MKKKRNSAGGVLLLICAAFLWGTTFAAQDIAADQIGPFTYLAARSLVGCLFLAVLIPFFDKMHIATRKPVTKEENHSLLCGGILCGIVLFFASWLQQYGIGFTTAGKAGFLTAFYIILVPIAGIFLHKMPSRLLIVSVILALIGLYFLCMTGSFSLGRGDVIILLSACFYAMHILVIDHFSPRTDGVRLSCIQFAVLTLISFVCMLLFEHPDWNSIVRCTIPILYAGVLSSGVAYTFQILGQKKVEPTIASLLMSLESVFSVLGGWVVLHQSLTGREILGCVLVFSAVILAQLPAKKKEAGGDSGKNCR